MSFSYDISLADPVSKVRSLIQDTVEITADFQDEEIEYFLAVSSDNVNKAASEAAFRLYVKYSKMADIEEVGKVRVEYVDRAKAMKNLYDAFIKEVTLRSNRTLMYFGGIERSKFNTNRADGSLVKPDFTKGTIFHDECNPDLPEQCENDSAWLP